MDRGNHYLQVVLPTHSRLSVKPDIYCASRLSRRFHLKILSLTVNGQCASFLRLQPHIETVLTCFNFLFFLSLLLEFRTFFLLFHSFRSNVELSLRGNLRPLFHNILFFIEVVYVYKFVFYTIKRFVRLFVKNGPNHAFFMNIVHLCREKWQYDIHFQNHFMVGNR